MMRLPSPYAAIAMLGMAGLGIVAAVAADYPDTAGSLPAGRKTIGVASEAPYNRAGEEFGNSAPGGGYTLLATIPAATRARLAYLIQAQCTAGVLVSFEDATLGSGGGNAPAYFSLAGPAAAGGQGGSLDMAGAPYSGAIKVFSSDAACRYAAWVNQ